MSKILLWRLLMILGLLGPWSVINAYAKCTNTSAPTVSFGTVTSFAVQNMAQNTSANSVGISCEGAAFVAAAVNYIYANVASGNGGNLIGTTGSKDKIPYSIYMDSAYSSKLDFGKTYNWNTVTGLNVFASSAQASMPLYFKTTPGSVVAAGTYIDTISIAWDWNICTLGIGSVCLVSEKGNITQNISVSLIVTNDCMVTAPDVNFGSAPTIDGFAPVAGQIGMTCTKGMNYTVGLSKGGNAASNGRRQMASGSNVLQYDIFLPGGSIVWDDVLNRVASEGTADGITYQAFPYVARIYADQATPPIGVYADIIQIYIRY